MTLSTQINHSHTSVSKFLASLQWRHNGHGSVLNHQPRDCLLNRLFRRRSKKTSKLRVTGPCAGNSPGTGEFPAQMASYAENVSNWWRHHDSAITMVSLGRHGVSNYLERDSLFDSWLRPTSKKISKFGIISHLWRKSTDDQENPLTKGL